jgi:hypothetical protein
MNQMRGSDEPGTGEHSGRAAARFALLMALAGVGFLIVAALWAHGCDVGAQRDTATCGPVQRTLLGLGAPLILFVGGLWAFRRTYRLWRERRPWWAWQGAGWFLLLLMLLTLTMGLPPIAGPALG